MIVVIIAVVVLCVVLPALFVGAFVGGVIVGATEAQQQIATRNALSQQAPRLRRMVR